MFQLHKNPAAIGRMTILIVGLVLTREYEKRYGTRSATVDACSTDRDFVSKVESEAKRLEIKGFMEPYGDCCFSGVLQGPKPELDEMKSWFFNNSEAGREGKEQVYGEFQTDWRNHRKFRIVKPGET
ncbi:uncharacterized protein LOC100900889 [Galendromus occidentalis]|uniref:Uncharacterized protein LOC100900889 n=1 Tax=Galendromus occidentalis TaxID=34638 RepID=A0AAJ7L7D6_9ACAR|nr:uncharacterized protein LOC100900889 [Galendromus occidentalis]